MYYINVYETPEGIQQGTMRNSRSAAKLAASAVYEAVNWRLLYRIVVRRKQDNDAG